MYIYFLTKFNGFSELAEKFVKDIFDRSQLLSNYTNNLISNNYNIQISWENTQS